MVIGELLSTWSSAAAVLAQNLAAKAEPARSTLERLEPQKRAKVILALVGLVLLGAALVGLVWLAGRWVRRTIRRPFPQPKARPDDWAARPLVSPERRGSDENPLADEP